MANNIAQFKIDLGAAFTNNFDAQTNADTLNGFVLSYPSDWQAFLTTNTLTDTPANRKAFALQKLFNHLYDINRAGKAIVQQTGLVPPVGIT